MKSAEDYVKRYSELREKDNMTDSIIALVNEVRKEATTPLITQSESEDELWNNVIDIVLHATANDCVNDLKHYFSISRKQ